MSLSGKDSSSSSYKSSEPGRSGLYNFYDLVNSKKCKKSYTKFDLIPVPVTLL